MLAKKQPIRTLADLAQHTLIVARSTHDDWKRVAQAAGVDELPCKDRLLLDSYLGAMVAAEQGLGLAIGLFPLMDEWIKAGRLAMPVPLRHRVPERHHFVVPHGRETDPHLQALRRWVKRRFDRLRAG